MANKRFGWNLPSAASILSGKDNQDGGSPVTDSADSLGADSEAASTSSGTTVAKAEKSEGGRSSQKPDTSNKPAPVSDAGLKYGFLRDVGGGIYQSPAGLQYLPMSNDEKHRLNHIERHLKDQPSRPVHGVFDGDMPQVVRWIDEAYLLVKSGDKRARQSENGRRDVYDIRFEKPIGYVGGQSGKRKNHPDARNLRMVLEGIKVVTAYPSD